MRRLLSAVGVLVSSALLASCALLPGGSPGRYSDDFQQAEARMEQIADALNAHDAAALKAMFSPDARERAVDIDDRLEYVLSFFPDGGVTWEVSTVGMEGSRDNGKRADLLLAYYTVFANGSKYRLFFGFYTVNDFKPLMVGIYAMGVTPMTGEPPYGAEDLFRKWAGAIHIDEPEERIAFGYPGVYFPVYDSPQVSDLVMEGIVEEIDSQDSVGLEERFAEYARTALGGDMLDQIDALFALLPEGDVAWEPLQDEPLVRRPPEADGAVLMLSTYPVSSGGKSYLLSFAVVTMNTTDPTKIGINAVGVAPRTPSEDSPQELALFGWLESFQVDAGPTPGIFIAE